MGSNAAAMKSYAKTPLRPTDIPIFQGLSPQKWAQVRPLISFVQVDVGHKLMETGETSEWVYFLIEGTVRIYRPKANGSHFILNVVGKGELLGEVCAIDSQGHSASAIATERSIAWRMRCTEFAQLKMECPTVSHSISLLLTQRLRFATQFCEALSAQKVQWRVARLLLALGYRYACGDLQKHVTIPVRLTQQEIAEWVSVSRQHASIHLQNLCAADLIEIGRGHRWVVKNHGALQELCEYLEDTTALDRKNMSSE